MTKYRQSNEISSIFIRKKPIENLSDRKPNLVRGRLDSCPKVSAKSEKIRQIRKEMNCEKKKIELKIDEKIWVLNFSVLGVCHSPRSTTYKSKMIKYQPNVSKQLFFTCLMDFDRRSSNEVENYKSVLIHKLTFISACEKVGHGRSKASAQETNFIFDYM